ncbi:unnamed protein product [Oncorhynchus mykiss]|uniref:Z-binding domain-containing protein n=1 Tax=Oncorhynchus mykiss TaxID=8022 RepID=A0A060YA22_ONCMY|nr:unnamed protein product [Oncorhynchus mykiss]
MSRGRGGPPIEHYHRPPLPQLQAKHQYYRAGPLGFNPRAPPQQAPHPNQVHFLRGQNTEAPQFRVSPRGGAQSLGRGGPNGLYNESNQTQAGYSRYSQNSSRGRGGYSSERGRGNGRDFGYPHCQGPPRGPTGPRFWNQKQTSTQKQGFNRHVPTFQPPDIREQVLQALADLSPGEKLQAKCLAKTLRLPKKFINQALYGLERDKKASKHGESPPEWTVYVEPQEEPEKPSESYRQHSHDMADCGSNQKELILQYLLEAGEATALVISKNLGLRGAKQVNPTLYAMEKQGDVSRNAEVTPHIWELSVHRRERMERSLKAERSAPAKVEGMGSGFQAVPPGLECLEANAEAVGGHSHTARGGGGGSSVGEFIDVFLNLGDPSLTWSPSPMKSRKGRRSAAVTLVT